VVEDWQGGDAPGGQGPAGGVGRLAGSWCGRGVIRPMVRVLIHGSPRCSCRREGPGGRPAAISADMVVRGEGSSRGQGFSVRLISIRLDVSRGPRDLRSRARSQVLVGKGGTGPWTLPRSGTRRRMACGMAACVSGGVAPVPHAPSTREVPFDLTFDQWEGNSEILRARCAEKGSY
jgi:hypothetical protein